MTADVITIEPSRKIMIESAKNIDKHINKELIVEVMLINKGPPKIMKTIPGQKLRAGSSRKASEITETWKQYSHRKIFGFFPMISDRFLPESTRN